MANKGPASVDHYPLGAEQRARLDVWRLAQWRAVVAWDCARLGPYSATSEIDYRPLFRRSLDPDVARRLTPSNGLAKGDRH